jgi:hypothetical protein
MRVIEEHSLTVLDDMIEMLLTAIVRQQQHDETGEIEISE